MRRLLGVKTMRKVGRHLPKAVAQVLPYLTHEDACYYPVELGCVLSHAKTILATNTPYNTYLTYLSIHESGNHVLRGRGINSTL